MLHYKDHQCGSLHRDYYHKQINELIKPLKYDGDNSKIVSEELFDSMLAIDKSKNKSRVCLAIERAEKIHKWHQNQDKTPSQSESSTTVHKLVETLIDKTKCEKTDSLKN